MRSFRDRPIRQKVALLIAAASAVGLLFAAGAVVAYELTTFRPRALRDVRTQADIIRVNSIASLQFNDPQAATENLSTLRRRPEILRADLFRGDGVPFARYAPPGAPPPPAELFERAVYLPDRLVLVERVEQDGQHVGWLSVQYAIPPLWRRLPQYGIMVAVVLLALGTAGALLLGMMGRSVSTPLLGLADAAREIAETRRFGLRVPPGSEDEIGGLTRAFNRMVATVEEQQGALAQSEARLRLALEAAEMETWMLDLSPGEDRALQELLARVHPGDRDEVAGRVRSALASGTAFDVEFRAEVGELEERWTALRGQIHREGATGPPRLIGVSHDVTEHRKMERQLIQSQRMEAIGNLAGGIAHDFNNLLTGMIGYLTFVQRRAPPDPVLRSDLAEVERAARRAAALTSQLLSYARRQMVVPSLVDLNMSVQSLEPMLRRLLGEDIEVRMELDADAGVTRVDAGQLEQVVLNLVANARDAMPAGGTLRIGTAVVVLNQAASHDHPETAPGEYAALYVADTGTGMTTGVRARLFEPFFTTKPPGSGTGLGLAMCYGIVKQSGGHIEVESEVGKGSRFTVLLPREAAAVATPLSTPDERAPGGKETILLVEDDDTVRELTSRSLRSGGYRVIEAPDAAAALVCAEQAGGAVDLLLTDVVMPGGSGRELAEGMTQRIPGLRVLFMSGYTADVVLRQGVIQEAVAFLPKPFSPIALAVAVRRALDGADS